MNEITGRKILILRTKLDITHKEFSSLIGCSLTSISRWEAYQNLKVSIQEKYKEKILALFQKYGIF